MHRRLVVSLVLSTCLAASAVLRAVTNGTPDGGNHPYVGVGIQEIVTLPGVFSVCSGSALSPTVFLTAAHCFDPDSPNPVLVSYDAAPASFAAFTPGTAHNDPDWCPSCGGGLPGFDSHDVAVVTLDRAPNPSLTSFATLPAAGLVDQLDMKSDVDIVGYGVQGFLRGGGAPTHQPEQIFFFTRFFAPSLLDQSNNSISDEFIKLTANPAKGKGGICFGDSGGPDLRGGTNVVLAVNSFVTNGNCSGVTYSQRIDLPDILAFIKGF